MSFSAADAGELLTQAHARDRLGHAYLITGPEGCGKRELVHKLASTILDEDGDALRHPDCHSLEPQMKSRRIGVEAVRELQRELQMRSLRGGKKIGILFDADRLNEQAANAFLKTLEEPPRHTHLFLLTALPDQLLETILSRCIEVPLLAAGRRAPTPLESELLKALRDFSQHQRPGLPQVFSLVRRFHDLLAEAKAAVADESDSALKKEEPLYKQVGNKDALEEREDFFKALTESRYLGERSRLLAIVEQWWADVLRQHVCTSDTECASPALHHPEFAADTASLASRFTAAQLLRKATALEALRENFGRNVQEQLAIEVGFLQAFGE